MQTKTSPHRQVIITVLAFLKKQRSESSTTISKNDETTSNLFHRIRSLKKVVDKNDATIEVEGTFCCSIPRNGTEKSTCSTDSESTATATISWQSSNKAGYHRHAPLLVRRGNTTTSSSSHENQQQQPRQQQPQQQQQQQQQQCAASERDDAQELGLIMARARKLPGTWYYSCNHIMVNQERTVRIIPPLTRERLLDELARDHALKMATGDSLHHSDPQDLQDKLGRPCRRLGENVAKGVTIRTIHDSMMRLKGDKNNVLDRRYTTFGMGTARGRDGTLYLCQIFRG